MTILRQHSWHMGLQCKHKMLEILKSDNICGLKGVRLIFQLELLLTQQGGVKESQFTRSKRAKDKQREPEKKNDL